MIEEYKITRRIFETRGQLTRAEALANLEAEAANAVTPATVENPAEAPTAEALPTAVSEPVTPPAGRPAKKSK